MARDLALTIDQLDCDRIDLVGYSMGAVAALIVTAEDPRVRRLAVGGVGSGVVEVGGVDTRVLDNVTLAAALRAPDPAAIENTMAAQFRVMADQLGRDRETLAEAALGRDSVEIPLERIAAPTLVLAGDADPLATRPEVLADAIPGARLQILSGDHATTLLDPRFAASLVEFLAEPD
jgi:pimeloyl-ACP methyl ester carboxylesterase